MKSNNLKTEKPKTIRIIERACSTAPRSLAQISLSVGGLIQVANNCEIILPGLELF